MQDCQYVLSHLQPVCYLLVQGSKINLQDGFTVVFYIEFRSF